jgi:hypothetical protein
LPCNSRPIACISASKSSSTFRPKIPIVAYRSLGRTATHEAWPRTPGTLQLSNLPGQAGLECGGSDFHAPLGFTALQHARRFCLIGGFRQGRGRIRKR